MAARSNHESPAPLPAGRRCSSRESLPPAPNSDPAASTCRYSPPPPVESSPTANQGPAFGKFLQQRAKAQGRRAQFVHRLTQFLNGVACFVLHLLHLFNATAQQRHIRWECTLDKQFV